MTRRRMVPSGAAIGAAMGAAAVLAAGLLASCTATRDAGGGGKGPALPTASRTVEAAPTGVESVEAAAPGVDTCVAQTGIAVAVIPVQGPGGPFTAQALGQGSRTVVVSDQSDEDLCAWIPLARHLTGQGYRVVLWNYAQASPVGELDAVVAATRATGPGPVALLGSSKGAKTTIVAAADLRPAVAGVVSLSAEEVMHPAITVADYVPRLPCPLLLLTSETDPWGSHTAAEEFRTAARPGTAQMVTLPGAAHGVDLLTGPTADTALNAIDSFLQRVLGGP